jgi:hypothetical protein
MPLPCLLLGRPRWLCYRAGLTLHQGHGPFPGSEMLCWRAGVCGNGRVWWRLYDFGLFGFTTGQLGAPQCLLPGGLGANWPLLGSEMLCCRAGCGNGPVPTNWGYLEMIVANWGPNVFCYRAGFRPQQANRPFPDSGNCCYWAGDCYRAGSEVQLRIWGYLDNWGPIGGPNVFCYRAGFGPQQANRPLPDWGNCSHYAGNCYRAGLAVQLRIWGYLDNWGPIGGQMCFATGRVWGPHELIDPFPIREIGSTRLATATGRVWWCSYEFGLFGPFWADWGPKVVLLPGGFGAPTS